MTEPTKQKQKDIQQRFMEYQMLEQQIKQLQQQLEKMEAQTAEVNKVAESVEDISKAKKGSEVLVPVSGGIFFRTTMQENSKFLVNVGSGVVVTKDAEGTKKLLKEQATEIELYKMHVAHQLEKSLEQYQMIENELKKLIEG
jgi:prefoldin alpha subunit